VEQVINGQTTIAQRLKEKELEVFGEMALFAQSFTEETVVADETKKENQLHCCLLPQQRTHTLWQNRKNL